MAKALVRSKNLTALALNFFKTLRSQLLSAAHFCAHFKVLKIFQLNFIQGFFTTKQVFLGNISLILENYVFYRKMSLDSCALEVFFALNIKCQI